MSFSPGCFALCHARVRKVHSVWRAILLPIERECTQSTAPAEGGPRSDFSYVRAEQEKRLNILVRVQGSSNIRLSYATFGAVQTNIP